MKKALFFMIFIFATAICGYAQEAPAAEQNDDSELILRYQNRRTMRGYKMLFEAGYQWGVARQRRLPMRRLRPRQVERRRVGRLPIQQFRVSWRRHRFSIIPQRRQHLSDGSRFRRTQNKCVKRQKVYTFWRCQVWLRHRRYPRCVCRIPSGSALLTSEAPCNLPAVPV